MERIKRYSRIEPSSQPFSGWSKRLPVPHSSWVTGLLLTLLIHVGVWCLPVSMPTPQEQPPRPIRLSLVSLPATKSMAVQQPSRARPKVRKHTKRRKRIHNRHRRHKRRRRLRRRKKRIRKRLRKRRKLRERRRAKRAQATKAPAPHPRPTPAPVAPPVTRQRRVAKATAPAPPPPPVTQTHKPKPAPRARSVSFGAYKRGLYHSIMRQKNYPMMARRMGHEGTVVLLFRVSKQGTLMGRPRILRSSRSRMLDQEAIRMVKAASPWRSMPTGYSRKDKAFRVTIRFSLDS